MSIRAKLIVLTTFVQLGSLALLSGGTIWVFGSYGRHQVARAEELMRHVVARTALDALIQRDQVQLLSYLNFLKGQYPALAYARVAWTHDGRTSTHTLGAPASGGSVTERRVAVEDPKQPGSKVEVAFGVDRVVLEAPYRESRGRIYRMLAAVGLATGAAGVVLSFLLAHRMTRPLQDLGRLAEEIGHGRLGARLDYDSPDELGVLVRAFNMMSERLEELDAVKRTFISSVTHELRSPLGAIESFLQLIRDKTAAEGAAGLAQCTGYLDRIQTNVRRLSGFINDLLDVAKIERGRMECELRSMQVTAVADEVLQFFEAKAGQQGVELRNAIKDAPPILGDSDRVRQVLVNLVANGLKFTPSGGRVWIEGEQVREGDQRFLEVTVADTGRGISDEDLKKLFQPFVQGTGVTHHAGGAKGTGLGLYIVKSIVEQHGGRIGVRSAPGQGTRVSFSLKVAA